MGSVKCRLRKTTKDVLVAAIRATSQAFIAAFNGEVKGVQLSIADDPNNAGHFVKPEDAIRSALGRQ